MHVHGTDSSYEVYWIQDFFGQRPQKIDFQREREYYEPHMSEIHVEGIGLARQKTHLTVHEPSNALYPDVFVGKLREEDRQALTEGKPVMAVKLGDDVNVNIQIKLTEIAAEGLRAELMRQANDAFLLLWEGNKIPRGAEVNGYRIGWTQNGKVLSADGKMIGVYDRLLEYGGESKKEQQMLVFVTVGPKTE